MRTIIVNVIKWMDFLLANIYNVNVSQYLNVNGNQYKECHKCISGTLWRWWWWQINNISGADTLIHSYESSITQKTENC